MILNKDGSPRKLMGRPSRWSGKVLRIVKSTTRVPGSIGDRNFNLIKDGMTYEEYKNAGGQRKCLEWEIMKGHVELHDSN